MISRQEFPYLQQLVINDAYAVKNLTIPVFEAGKDFKHLILTGKNGSGKTTILSSLNNVIRYDARNARTAEAFVANQKERIQDPTTIPSQVKFLQDEIRGLEKVRAVFFSANYALYKGLTHVASGILYAFFEATRNVKVKDVTSVAREDELVTQLAHPNPEEAAGLFKQYLVNKKVFQVFDVMEGKSEEAKQQERFFAVFEKTLAKIFEDPGTKLEFVRENFEFYINLSDGRRFTFNQLSAGFSAFLSILTELLMRTDLLRKQANDYTYDPCGFVLIDEPETHLHLEMQYQILPLLTSLFPNLQFIVATHSPAVASSITGATVFDLSTGKILGDQAAGSSFSELMQTHFGVENEYSNVADAILAEVDEIRAMTDRPQALAQLQRLIEEKGKYMSPVLQLDIQAQILHLKREQAV